MIEFQPEMAGAIVFGALVVPAIVFYRSHKKIKVKLKYLEDKNQNLRAAPRQQNDEELKSLYQKLQNQERSADLLGRIIAQKDKEISSTHDEVIELKKELRQTKELVESLRSKPQTERVGKRTCRRQDTFEQCIEIVRQHQPDMQAYKVNKIFPEHFQFRLDVYGAVIDNLSYFVEIDTEQKITLLKNNGEVLKTFDNSSEFKGWLN